MTEPQPVIAVIDYGIGNLRSAEKALQRVGAKAALSSDRGFIRDADAVVLPGVGAFGACMTALRTASFKSIRGDFKFNSNQFPIQDFHIFEAVRDGQGRMTLKTIATPLKQISDNYAEKCQMKM